MSLAPTRVRVKAPGRTAPARSASLDKMVVAPIYVAAFLSGAAALIYEIAWARMLALTFGSTTLSAGAVIAGFMGGWASAPPATEPCAGASAAPCERTAA